MMKNPNSLDKIQHYGNTENQIFKEEGETVILGSLHLPYYCYCICMEVRLNVCAVKYLIVESVFLWEVVILIYII